MRAALILLLFASYSYANEASLRADFTSRIEPARTEAKELAVRALALYKNSEFFRNQFTEFGYPKVGDQLLEVINALDKIPVKIDFESQTEPCKFIFNDGIGGVLAYVDREHRADGMMLCEGYFDFKPEVR